MIKLIRNEEAKERKISDSYTVFNLLTKETSKKVSFALAEAKNHSEITKNVKSDRVYYVLEGQLIVSDGSNIYIANPGDLIFIEANTPYHFKGSFKAILINVPAFDAKNEKILKILSE